MEMSIKKAIPGLRFLALFIMLPVLVASIWSGSAFSADVSPQYINVGIAYSNNTVAGYYVTSAQGVAVGFFGNSGFIGVAGLGANVNACVTEDANYGDMKYYQLWNQTSPSGTKTKLYHIRIGDYCSTLSAAQSAVNTYKSKGVKTYIGYDGNWFVAEGFYTSPAEVDDNIANRVKPATGVSCYTVWQSEKRVLVSDSIDMVFMIDLSVEKLIVTPNNGAQYKMNVITDGVSSIKRDLSTYWGDSVAEKPDSNRITVVANLSMDQYLYGVTPSEIGSSSPLDAIKAQAIIARTYASLKAQSGAYADLGFDICPTTECQVFFGSKSETLRSNQAVDSTSGRVLLYGGKFAQTFFFSSTGGTVTEDPVYVWGGSIPYLKSVDSSVEDTGYSNYNWTIQLTKEQIKAKVTGIGDITNVQITGRAPSGRAIELKVSGTSGSKTYTKDTCRSILGLKSQMFEITTDIDGKNTYDPNANETIFDVVVADGTVWKEINARDLQFQTVDGTRTVTEGDTIDIVDADGSIKTVTILPHATPPPNTVTPNLYTFTGKGYGHAVGMSQTGAMGLAKLGYTYDQIIYHYFPGTTLS